jgi:PPK2 family polyphosphate:nucleotide phosphotransferase
MASLDYYRVRPHQEVDLRRWDPADASGVTVDEAKAKKELEKAEAELAQLQELFYADGRHRLLIVLEGMDTAGKDSTIRRVFRVVNPSGVRVAKFGIPTDVEKAHSFLWRVYAQLPAKGEIVIFNRSHYEDVLTVRVHELVPKKVVKRRYREIVEFERTLVQEGTTIVKFFLHIDAAEQARRLGDRYKDPTKHWKFSIHDLDERPLWKEYRKAYEVVLERTSTKAAPWYLVPSNQHWLRDTIIARVLLAKLRDLHLEYPPLSPDVARRLKREPWAIAPGAAKR